jgi:hypothetical protein
MAGSWDVALSGEISEAEIVPIRIRTGIVPDIEATPTVDGIRQAAMRCWKWSSGLLPAGDPRAVTSAFVASEGDTRAGRIPASGD